MNTLIELVTEKKPMMVLNVVHVTISNKSRDIQVFSYNSQIKQFENISNLVALELDMPFKNGGVRIRGLGSDMTFMLKYEIEQYIEATTGVKIEIKHNGVVREKDLPQIFQNMLNYYSKD